MAAANMSILQRILKNMFIEPELLAELDEEQKQILFCKMREEQLKRWDEYDARAENKRKKANRKGCNVKFLSADGRPEATEPWVWVMGEHANDSSIDQIIDHDLHLAARKLAHEETERLRLTHEQQLKETLATQLNDDLLEVHRHPSPPGTQPEPSNATDQSAVQQLMQRIQSLPSPRTSESPTPSEPESTEDKLLQELVLRQQTDQSLTNQVPAPNQKPEILPKPSVVTAPQATNPKPDDVERILLEQSQREIDGEMQRREQEIYVSLNTARQRVNYEAEVEQRLQQIQWEEQERKAREYDEHIRTMARRAREQASQHNLDTAVLLQHALEHRQTTEDKDKESSQSSSSSPAPQDPVINGNGLVARLSPITKVTRPSKPKSRQAILKWFEAEERGRGTGLDPRTGHVCHWFHGIVSRESAEQMLRNHPVGAFLVRVSERIWGYTLSYCLADGQSKHFLIERTQDGYQFLGTNQIVHASLFDLVNYHQTVPVSEQGKEFLRHPIGQQPGTLPDYHDILPYAHRT